VIGKIPTANTFYKRAPGVLGLFYFVTKRIDVVGFPITAITGFFPLLLSSWGHPI
jgi:hypothetical protein